MKRVGTHPTLRSQTPSLDNATCPDIFEVEETDELALRLGLRPGDYVVIGTRVALADLITSGVESPPGGGTAVVVNRDTLVDARSDIPDDVS